MLPTTIFSRSKFVLGYCARRQPCVVLAATEVVLVVDVVDVDGSSRAFGRLQQRPVGVCTTQQRRHLSTNASGGSGSGSSSSSSGGGDAKDANGKRDEASTSKINPYVFEPQQQQQQQQQRQQQIVSPPPPPRSSATSSASDTAPTTTTTTTTTTAFATANGGSPAAPPTTTSSDETSTLSAIPPSESNVLEDGTPLPQTPGITPSTSDFKSTNTGTGKELPTAPSSSSSSLADTAVVAVGGDDSSSGSGVFASFYDRAHRLWSDRSGMSEIYELKQSVDTAGASYDLASAEVTKNRRDLDGALRKWETASGQHLQLLQRRESWTADDAQRFADFVALEITSRAELEQAKHVLARSEEALTRAQLDYINKMRRRYHEEQIWQDQWRVLGTYGTWSLIVLNSCVFLGSQYFQRRRERERMDTIAQLIAENNNNSNNNNNNHHDNGAAAMNPKQAEQRLVVGETSDMQTSAVDVEKLTDQDAIATKDDQSNHHEQEKTKEEKTSTDSPTIFTTDESLEAELTERSHSEGDTAGKVGQEPNNHNDDSNIYRGVERVGNAVGSVGAAVSQWEHRVRSDAKELALSVHQKLSKALPPNVASKMPKSVSDIDVPSAIIGASVGGITVLTVSLIISSFSGRRQ